MRRTIDDLSPEERFEIQAWYVRAYQARRRRRLYDAERPAPGIKRYDVAGQLVAVDGVACDPHVSSWAEDRPVIAAARRT
jgi:hypothetical protein